MSLLCSCHHPFPFPLPLARSLDLFGSQPHLKAGHNRHHSLKSPSSSCQPLKSSNFRSWALKHSQIPSSRICPPSSSINHLKSSRAVPKTKVVCKSKNQDPASSFTRRSARGYHPLPLSSRVRFPLLTPHWNFASAVHRRIPQTCPVVHLICRRTRNVRASFSFLP
ncbi:hypothetical protein B0H14DRAFT_2757625 [Mycena olivaceomarginata]|nr:hypothetical protein B0H14DRAFT_2757625 [Mycena olivaceomarginata]